LIVGQIQDDTSAQDIDQILHKIPSSLDGLLAQIMEQISSQAEGDAELGRSVLCKLFAAQEPMRTETLLDAMARDTGWEITSDQVQNDRHINRCVQCCKGLIGLVAQDDGNVVAFVHFSVKDYLEVNGVSNETQK
jgi:hypothetical protein